MRPSIALHAGAVALTLAGAAAFAGFAGTDLFLPMAGRQAGVHPSNWYTTVWIHNPGAEAATARVFFLERTKANTAPPWVDVLVAPGDSEKLENIVETYFHLEAFGALRVTCETQRLVVTSRVFSQGVGADAADSVGQDFAGVPASFAIGLGEKSQVLGVHQTLPTVDSEFRFNFGLVETTGHSATVRVRAFDENGDDRGFSDINVRELSQRQVAFKDHFPTVTTENARLELEVISGAGRVIAYGSGIANASQDPTTFEMTYKDELLGAGTITGVTAGDGLTGGGVDGAVSLAVGAGDGIAVAADTVSLADGGVTTPKLATAAVTPDRIAPSATVGQVLTTVSAGSSSPLETMSLAGNAVAWQTPVAGDITEVTAGDGLDGGATEGAASLSVEVPLVLSGNYGSSTWGEWRGIVKGTNSDRLGSGVVGINLANGYGVAGIAASGFGVFGRTESNGGGVAGVVGYGNTAGTAGVRGNTSAGVGVSGDATTGTGVYGASHSGRGVVGQSDTDVAVFGSTASGNVAAVRGDNSSSWAGVEGSCDNGSGVYGRTTVGSAVHGYASSTGRAGFFRGKVEIQGNLTKSSGSFRIDHPLDPANKYLSHSFVESPDMMNVYNGNVVTDGNGEAVVEVPEWFEALNRDYRYQLTVIGQFAQAIVDREVENNSFVIRTNLGNVKVSWQVTGIRQDAWANAHRVPVEEDKPAEEVGTYLAPEVWGLPEELGLQWQQEEGIRAAAGRNAAETPPGVE